MLTLALLAAPGAAADPDDLVPYCTGGQRPTTGECKAAPNSDYPDHVPGADPAAPFGLDPLMPSGLDPGSSPAI